ncbi:arsenic transporter [Thermoleophilia bacterium SCSIO 60948]|nr:arsenic transporter [Thermoleophilia bacterium SCSIO 60948]
MFDPWPTLAELAPTLGFLAALLLLAEGCRRERLFDWLGERIASAPGARRRFARAFAAAAAITIALSLDATVLLLVPMLLAAAARRRRDPLPAAFASLHLANSASLLLPVSNLTGLLVATQAEIPFTRFAMLMAAPWAVAVAIEWLVLRRRFARPIDAEPDAAPSSDAIPTPRAAIAIVALSLAGVLAASAIGLAPLWPVLAGALVLVAFAATSEGLRASGLVLAVKPLFLIAVVALALLVEWLGELGLSEALAGLVPAGDSPAALLATCLLAALLANLVNNIPATLILIPVLAPAGEPALLAALIGLGVGPNLTPWGSLATLLWRSEMRRAGLGTNDRLIFELGIATVPAILVASTLALWLALELAG